MPFQPETSMVTGPSLHRERIHRQPAILDLEMSPDGLHSRILQDRELGDLHDLVHPRKVVQRDVVGLERPLPGEAGEERQHVLPQRAVQVQIGGDVAEAYLATGASICTVVNAWNAAGMLTFSILRPTSKVGLAGSVVS